MISARLIRKWSLVNGASISMKAVQPRGAGGGRSSRKDHHQDQPETDGSRDVHGSYTAAASRRESAAEITRPPRQAGRVLSGPRFQARFR